MENRPGPTGAGYNKSGNALIASTIALIFLYKYLHNVKSSV